MINWVHDKVNKEYRPTLFPGESTESWSIPEAISTDFYRLNAIIENKYSREYLKVCAFFNKMFPSLKTSDWSQSAYNAPPFTAMDQERTDTGYGTNYNYLKQIVDQLTSRLGTVSFVPKLLSEEQSYEYIVYKDEVERVLRKFILDDNLNSLSVEAFHNAAVLGYSHALIDPYTGTLIKANDYEVGMFDSQFNRRDIKQLLYRDYAFPVSRVANYIKDLNDKGDESIDKSTEILEAVAGRTSVEFSMYFDCVIHKVYVTIAGKTLPPMDYPFDNVLIATFSWDTSFSRQLTCSMFDLLYPIQREINRIAAKSQQLIRLYKGAIPVFNSDVDIAMKAITNGTGEALYIDSTRSTAELMTVINPTPLDPQLDAEIQSRKTAMYELAGIQSSSFNMDNMRSAAAVIALDQTRDTVFQSQLAGLAQFIKQMFRLYVKYFSMLPDKAPAKRDVDWKAVDLLVDGSYIDMQPVHLNDPVSDENKLDDQATDFVTNAASRITLDIIKGKTTYAKLPYYIDVSEMVINVAVVLIKFAALGVSIPMHVHKFLIDAYIDLVKQGAVML